MKTLCDIFCASLAITKVSMTAFASDDVTFNLKPFSMWFDVDYCVSLSGIEK